MKQRIYRNTEVTSYFLWEYTKHGNALNLWYCAEQICYYMDSLKIYTMEDMNGILSLPKDDPKYINFVRNISYRIYEFIKDDDSVRNWFIAERLLKNGEWASAVLNVANAYAEVRNGDFDVTNVIRTEGIKKDLMQ